MATLQQRRCDLCGREILPGEVVGLLYLPPGTDEEVRQRIQAEVDKLNPVVAMSTGAVQEIAQRHQRGKRWDVCTDCVHSLTTWSGEAMVKWAAAGFRRLPEGQGE